MPLAKPVRLAHRLLRRGAGGANDSLVNVMLMVKAANQLSRLENFEEELPLRSRIFEFCKRQPTKPLPIYQGGGGFFSDHPELAFIGSEFYLYKCFAALGRDQAADILITHVEAEMIDAIGPRDPAVLSVRHCKAQSLVSLGRLQEARDRYLDIWNDYEELGLLHSPEGHNASFGLMRVLNKLDDKESALRIARRILDANSAQLEIDHPQTLEAMEMVAQFLFQTENLSEALVVATSLSELRFRVADKSGTTEDAVRAQDILERIRAKIAMST